MGLVIKMQQKIYGWNGRRRIRFTIIFALRKKENGLTIFQDLKNRFADFNVLEKHRRE